MARKRRTTYVGNAEALQFLRKKHPHFAPPSSDLFAFAQGHGTDNVVYVLVSENDTDLEAVACRWCGKHGMKQEEFEELQEDTWSEARQCQIEAPFSVTVINNSGAFSYCMRRRRRTKGAA